MVNVWAIPLGVWCVYVEEINDVHPQRGVRRGGGGGVTGVQTLPFGSVFFFLSVACLSGRSCTVEPLYNEVLGTMKITLLYQVSHYIRVKKQRNIKKWDQQNDLVITGFCYIRPLYNEVPLYITRIPLPCVWKIDATFLRKGKESESPQLSNLFRAGAASRPASNYCTTPHLQKPANPSTFQN